MVTTPRYSEFKGIYNVDAKFLGEVDRANVLCNNEGLEPPTLAEIEMIVDEIETLNQHLLQSAQVLSYSIGFCDRTACLTFLNLEFLNEANLHQNRSWTPREIGENGFRGMCGGSQFDVASDGDLVPFLESGDRFAGALCALAYDKRQTKNEISFVNPANSRKFSRRFTNSEVLSDGAVRFLLDSEHRDSVGGVIEDETKSH